MIVQQRKKAFVCDVGVQLITLIPTAADSVTKWVQAVMGAFSVTQVPQRLTQIRILYQASQVDSE